MIEAGSFVEAARDFGFSRYTGVPCSFLTPFINYVINDDSLDYISSANEGDAVATAAGSAIGGQRAVVMMQNSGLGNAVSPLTSLNHVFRIPVLIITTHRGAPGVNDEPQHELTGRITGELFDIMQIPWSVFPDTEEKIRPALQTALDCMLKNRRPYAFIMAKDTVAPHALRPQARPDGRNRAGAVRTVPATGASPLSRHDALRSIVEHTPASNTVIIATTGYTGRELFRICDRENQLYMVGSMGCASSLGLGLSLAKPDLKIVVIDGDGAALMRMGNFATVGHYAGKNLVHILLDNEVHESTGAQATVSATVDFAAVAHACNYPLVSRGQDPAVLDDLFNAGHPHGPRFAHLKIRSGTADGLPRPDIAPEQVLQRLMHHIHTEF